MKNVANEAIELLKQMIETPSFSGEEHAVTNLLTDYLDSKRVNYERLHNNVWACSAAFSPAKPTLLLNSHLDTVRPQSGWQRDPFKSYVEGGKLYGLGSNDAGASLVSLLMTFLHFFKRTDLNYNLVFLASAEEETTGNKGIRPVLQKIGQPRLAIVGEPTEMQMAVAEKGLLVLRCRANGKAGHAARDIGENAIAIAMEDINWFHSYKFPQVSQTLGPVKMTVTMIQAGTQHNVVPAFCDFTVDIRTTDCQTNEQVLDVVKAHIKSKILQSSLRLKPSGIPANHPLVREAKRLGIGTFGSPTLSDQAQIDAPSVKMGPGRSERSHTADEFVYLSEIEQGIVSYVHLLENFLGK